MVHIMTDIDHSSNIIPILHANLHVFQTQSHATELCIYSSKTTPPLLLLFPPQLSTLHHMMAS